MPNLAWLPSTFSHGAHHLPATVSRRGPRPTGPNGGTTPGALSPGGGVAGGRCAGHPGLHGLPSGPLAEAVVQQPAGTAEPRDTAPQSLPPKGDVVGIFPNRLSARRLVGAVLAEQHDEWPKPAATSPSPTPPAARHCRSPICWKQRPDQHQQGRRAFTLLVCCSSPVDRPICGAGERGASFTSG